MERTVPYRTAILARQERIKYKQNGNNKWPAFQKILNQAVKKFLLKN